MSDFADLARSTLRSSGYSMKAAARALNYDAAYLSRVLNRKQRPSAQLAKSLDALVGANGELMRSALEPRHQVPLWIQSGATATHSKFEAFPSA
ncbi:helix-turn-helix transcriptional regulator [Streptomyces sp. M19]